MSAVRYATREAVKSAMDVKLTARADRQVDDAIEAASRAVEALCHRRFYPWTGTRYFDWPNAQYARPWRLWLDDDEVISVTSLVAGGETIASTDYFLEPANSGPPYTHIEIDLDSTASFSSTGTHQRSIAVTGVFGYQADETTAGELAEALDASETAVDVTDSASVGVGDLLRVDTERMIVTGKSMTDSGQNTGTALAASNSVVSVPVSDGTQFAYGEIILVGAERMLIVDVAGNTLTVRRAWDGTVLAAHDTGSDIYVPRTLTVERGVLGTTAASHDTAAAIVRHEPPSLVRQYVEAEAISTLLQRQAGYARTAGSGDNQRETAGRALRYLRDQTVTAHGRKCRLRAV